MVVSWMRGKISNDDGIIYSKLDSITFLHINYFNPMWFNTFPQQTRPTCLTWMLLKFYHSLISHCHCSHLIIQCKKVLTLDTTQLLYMHYAWINNFNSPDKSHLKHITSLTFSNTKFGVVQGGNCLKEIVQDGNYLSRECSGEVIRGMGGGSGWEISSRICPRTHT